MRKRTLANDEQTCEAKCVTHMQTADTSVWGSRCILGNIIGHNMAPHHKQKISHGQSTGFI